MRVGLTLSVNPISADNAAALGPSWSASKEAVLTAAG